MTRRLCFMSSRSLGFAFIFHVGTTVRVHGALSTHITRKKKFEWRSGTSSERQASVAANEAQARSPRFTAVLQAARKTAVGRRRKPNGGSLRGERAAHTPGGGLVFLE